MCYTISVTNDSGAAQTVAVLAVDPGQSGAFPLVWQSRALPTGAMTKFDCDNSKCGLGWGTTATPFSLGARFTQNQMQQVGPVGAIDAGNHVDLIRRDGNFSVAPSYADSSVPDGQILLASDQSFTVNDAINEHACVALFVQLLPVMAQQLAPGTDYYFSPTSIIFYLTVTRALPGTAVPVRTPVTARLLTAFAASMTHPTPVPFGPDATDLSYTLTSTLTFQPVAGT